MNSPTPVSPEEQVCNHSPLYTYDSVGRSYRAPCPWCLQRRIEQASTATHVALLEVHGQSTLLHAPDFRAVLVPPGQSLDFDEGAATRRWLHPYLGNQYHLSSFIEVLLPSKAPFSRTCEERHYEAASKILEDEGPLSGNCLDNANELGALIQQWIERKHDNWEPT